MYRIEEILSIDVAENVDYEKSNNKGFRYISSIMDNFSKHIWGVPEKSSQTKTNEVSNTLTSSKRKPIEIETDRGAEFYHSNFLKTSNDAKNTSLLTI